MKNLYLLKLKEANKYFKRNPNVQKDNYGIINLCSINNLKPKSILEIGCANGIRLNDYSNILRSKTNYGIDISSNAIKDAKKKFKKLHFLKMSSLEINKIKKNFDLIICGFFLYMLDREEIFNQFDLIYRKLNKNGYLIIEDFDPLFKHTNNSTHNKNFKSFKMNYDHFLEESGLFKTIYKIRKNSYFLKKINFRKKFKSSDVSLVLLKKIDFSKSYPENITHPKEYEQIINKISKKNFFEAQTVHKKYIN